MRKPQYDLSIFKKRREELRTTCAGSGFLLVSSPEHKWIPHRQDSNFFYLSGFEEPESVLLLRPGQTPEMVLFVRAKDELRETWDGFRYGPEGAVKEFHADQAFLLNDLPQKLPQMMASCEKLYVSSQLLNEQPQALKDAINETRNLRSRPVAGRLPLFDASEVLGEMRRIKSDEELNFLKEVGNISSLAHQKAMEFVRPGVSERQVMGQLLAVYFDHNARREGYNAIVASGANSTTLHYNFNDQICHAGDLLLIDSGCEKNYYTADITRTFPVSGRYSSAQKEVYERVLSVQKQLIDMVKPGVAFAKLQEKTVELLTQHLLELRLLSGSIEENVQKLNYKKYYPHGVSHYLGMDVHDEGAYFDKDISRPLDKGVVLTIEPGLYIPQSDESAPAALRGIGIRIEDDIAVTTEGCVNLTVKAPKEIQEIEGLVGRAYKN